MNNRGDTVMQEVELTWGRAIKVWWSLAWRGLLFGGLAGFVAGMIVGVLGGEPIHGSLAGFVMGIPIGMWVVKIILAKSFSDFRLALIPIDS
jgi:ABC-type antimicrobial peptide transport system permease subunit